MRSCAKARPACVFFFSSRRRHTRSYGDWSSDVCSSDLQAGEPEPLALLTALEEYQDLPRVLDRGRELPEREVGVGEIEVAGDAKPELTPRLCRREAALAVLDRLVLLSFRPVVLHEERVDRVQALGLVIPGRERLRFLETLEEGIQTARAPEGRAHGQADVDTEARGLGRLRESAEGIEDQLVELHGLGVDEERCGLLGRRPRIVDDLVPNLAA